MRLVKATRPLSRRHLAVLVLPLALAACEDPADEGAAGAEQPGVRELCRMEGVVPLRPRLVVTSLYGEPVTLARPVCVACFAGGEGAWVAGDRDTIEVHVGDRLIEIANDRRSRLRTSHALNGVALGRGAALLDLGGSWLLLAPDAAPVPLLPLPLAPGQLVWSVQRRHGAVTVLVRGDRPPVEAIVPLLTPAPTTEAPPQTVPVGTVDGSTVGFLERSAHGVATIGMDGRRFVLGDTRSVLSASLVGDTLVAWAPRETVVASAAGGVDRVRPPDSVQTDGRDVAWFDDRGRRVRVVADGAWITAGQARAGQDFGGAPLPEGAQSIRLEGALALGHVAVVERLQGLDCSVSDRLHILDLEGHGARMVADDARLRLHIAPVDDGFGWVEADVGRIGP